MYSYTPRNKSTHKGLSQCTNTFCVCRAKLWEVQHPCFKTKFVPLLRVLDNVVIFTLWDNQKCAEELHMANPWKWVIISANPHEIMIHEPGGMLHCSHHPQWRVRRRDTAQVIGLCASLLWTYCGWCTALMVSKIMSFFRCLTHRCYKPCWCVYNAKTVRCTTVTNSISKHGRECLWMKTIAWH